MGAKEIKALRHKLGLTQQKFAEKLGMSMSTIARWEIGLNKPSFLALEKLNQIKKEAESNAIS